MLVQSARTTTRIKRFALLLAIALIAVMIISPSAQALPDDYPADLKNKDMNTKDFDPWGFAPRNCTSFVAWRLVNANGFKEFNNYITGKGDKRLSNAGNWGLAVRGHYDVNSTPAKGAVLWTPASKKNIYGHVAWVESVDSANGKVTIEEYNRDGKGHFQDPRRTLDSKGLQFIHFKDIREESKPQAAKPSPANKPQTTVPTTSTSDILSSYAGTYTYRPTPGWSQTITIDNAGNATYKGEGPDYPSTTLSGKFKVGIIYVTDSDGSKPHQAYALLPASNGAGLLSDMFIKRDTGVIVEASNYDASYPDAAVSLPSMTGFCASNASSAWKQKCGI